MSKIIWLILFAVYFCQPAWAGEKLNSKIIKDGEPVPAGWVCYDGPSRKVLDNTQKAAIDCKVDLQKAQKEITAIKAKLDHDVTITALPTEEWYDATWVKISLGAVVGLSLGLGLGAAL